MDKRASGILLHISSLPSSYGIGDLGPFAYAFIDFLRKSKQSYWQILPINPTDGINGHSPYSCFSAFAGNPLFISPDLMVMDGFLSAADMPPRIKAGEDAVDYATAALLKEKIFDKAYARFVKQQVPADYQAFLDDNAYWLHDFALFMVIKASFKGACWHDWPMPLKQRKAAALKQYYVKHRYAVERIKFIQFLFFRQWARLKKYANAQGIGIIGDIPIYVNYDSVEVWCYPQFFKLDADGALKFVSGCPPDYFAKTGQRWGNPVYDWAALKKSKYSWWVRRVAHDLSLFDYLRVDHFRGFLSFWQIPAHEKLAVFGRWVKGPGVGFFNVLSRRIKPLPIVAEDLGEITPDVPALMKRFNIPGMRVLLFAFGGDLKTNPHVPANYPKHAVVYTGTHDNNTIQGWYAREANAHEKAHVKALLKSAVQLRQLHWQMIKALMQSRADTVIISMADILGLKEDGRMNTPATKNNNWKWRLPMEALTAALARQLSSIVISTRR